MNQLLGDSILFVSLFGVFVSLLLLCFVRYSGKSNIYLSLFLFLNAIYAASVYVVNYVGSVELLAALYGSVSPLFFLLGPFCFLYVKTVLKNDARLTRKYLWHCLPFVIQFINSLPYIFTSFDYKVQHVGVLINDVGALPYVNTGWFFTPAINYFLRPGHIFVYSLAACMLLYKQKRKDEVLVRQKEAIIQWLFLFCLINLVQFGCSFVITLWAYSTDNIAVAIRSSRFFIMIAFSPYLLLNGMIFFFPQVLYGLPGWHRPSDKP